MRAIVLTMCGVYSLMDGRFYVLLLSPLWTKPLHHSLAAAKRAHHHRKHLGPHKHAPHAGAGVGAAGTGVGKWGDKGEGGSGSGIPSQLTFKCVHACDCVACFVHSCVGPACVCHLSSVIFGPLGFYPNHPPLKPPPLHI